MAKKSAVKYHVDFFEIGVVKYAAGQAYPETDETLRAVALGHAEKVKIDVAEIAEPADLLDPAPVEVAAPDTPVAQEPAAVV